MKQTIWGRSPAHCKKLLIRRLAVCGTVLFVTLVLNLVCLASRTEVNHTWMLAANILSDIACGFFLVYYISEYVSPNYSLYKLIGRETADLTGRITHIAQTTTRYMDMDCYAVTVDSRRLFLPAGTVQLQENELYQFRIAANMILEAEQ